jgi:hypothetical protein
VLKSAIFFPPSDSRQAYILYKPNTDQQKVKAENEINFRPRKIAYTDPRTDMVPIRKTFATHPWPIPVSATAHAYHSAYEKNVATAVH